MVTRMFIVAFPRSGTTLLQSFLSAHPSVLSFPETHFWARLRPKRGVWTSLGLPSQTARSTFRLVRGEAGLPAKAHRLGPANAWNRRLLSRSFVRLLDSWASAQGCTHWVEKTPRHLYFLDEIEQDAPEALFVHLLRNGPEAVASLYDTTRRYPEEWGGPRSVEQCVKRWNRDLETTLSYHGQPRHHIVRYEALVDDPVSVLRELCAFAGLSFTHRMITDRGSGVGQIVSRGEEWKKGVRGTLMRSPSKFDRVFTPEEREFVLSRLKQIPEGLGGPSKEKEEADHG